MSAEGTAARMIEVARLLGEVPTIINQAVEKANEAYNEAEAAKSGGLRHGGSAPATNTAPARQPAPRPLRPWKVRPERAAAIRRIGWPKKPNGEVRARGILYGSRDEPLAGSEGRPLRAGRNGPAAQRTDLKPAWTDPDMSTTWHIEGHTAAWMINHDRKEAILYINQPVCGTDPPKNPQRCGSNLQHVLPVGYTLYVHSILEDGSKRVTKHEGTGKAIK